MLSCLGFGCVSCCAGFSHKIDNVIAKRLSDLQVDLEKATGSIRFVDDINETMVSHCRLYVRRIDQLTKEMVATQQAAAMSVLHNGTVSLKLAVSIIEKQNEAIKEKINTIRYQNHLDTATEILLPKEQKDDCKVKEILQFVKEDKELVQRYPDSYLSREQAEFFLVDQGIASQLLEDALRQKAAEQKQHDDPVSVKSAKPEHRNR